MTTSVIKLKIGHINIHPVANFCSADVESHSNSNIIRSVIDNSQTKLKPFMARYFSASKQLFIKLLTIDWHLATIVTKLLKYIKYLVKSA